MRAFTLIVGILLCPLGVAVGQPSDGGFRISFQQGTGDADFGARLPAVAYNSAENEYLVVWQGQFRRPFPICPTNGSPEQEIHRQRINAATGALIGPAEAISSSGPACLGERMGAAPAIAYNATANEYLVVWRGDDAADGLANQEFEIFGQRLDSTGTEVGEDDFRISDLGGIGDPSFDASDPAVAWNAVNNEYLVVWSGDDADSGQADNETEIYGQFLNAAGGEIGENDFRISEMGVDGDTRFTANHPAVAWNPRVNQYLVVWEGSDISPGARELEIFGQRIRNNGDEIGRKDFRISFQQGSGDPNFRATLPDLAYDSTNNQYLVVWQGQFQTPSPTCPANSPTEQEIHGQRLDANTGDLLGSAGIISSSGPSCDGTHNASSPAAAYSAAQDEFLVVWSGDDNTDGLVDNEFEIFGRRLNGDGAPTAEKFRISAMGGTGNQLFDAASPVVTWNPADEFFVAWHGDDNQGGLIDNELEIFGARLVEAIFADGFE